MCLLAESFSSASCDLYSASYSSKKVSPPVHRPSTTLRTSLVQKTKNTVATAAAATAAAAVETTAVPVVVNSLSMAKPSSLKPKDSQRARKQMKKILKKQDELRTKFVQQLSSVEKFSFVVTGNDTAKSVSLDQEFIDRFVSFAGLVCTWLK